MPRKAFYEKRGLKRRARKRKLVIDPEMKAVLASLLRQSRCDFVFTSPQDPATQLGPRILETQITKVRKKISTHPDAGLHALRHYAESRNMPNRDSEILWK